MVARTTEQLWCDLDAPLLTRLSLGAVPARGQTSLPPAAFNRASAALLLLHEGQLFVKGFGCRPDVTYPPVAGPGSESLRGRNPRAGDGRCAVYGDLIGSTS